MTKRRSGRPSSTRGKRLTDGALPVIHADSDTITDPHIMKLIGVFHRHCIGARLAKHEQHSQALETSSSTRHGKQASMLIPSTTAAVKEVIERAQQAKNANVIDRPRVEAMQQEMDILKNTVEELRNGRYTPSNTESVSDTSLQWVEILNQLGRTRTLGSCPG